jgi:hypothetical protein
MPCRNDDADCQTYGQVTRELDVVTRMLCAVCGRITADGMDNIYIHDADPELSKWWEEHQKKDAERRERERQQKTNRLMILEAQREAAAKEIETIRKELSK